MASKFVFARREKKYLLDQAQYDALIQTLADYMNVDAYGKYTICNIYLDTPDYALIRASLGKPSYKEKLRLRSYGVPAEEDTVFLELKKKCGGTVYKRRASMPLADARQYLQGTETPEDSQIMRELDWSLRRYQPEPTVFIAYEREAYQGIDDPELRITFDTGLRWRRDHLTLEEGAWGNPLVADGQVLMEVKTLNAMPLWLSRRLTALKIFPTSFSKYGTCYREHLADPTPQRGVTCA